MSITETTSVGISSGGRSIQGSVTETGSVEINLDEQFPAASTNAPLAAVFATATLQSFYLVASQDMTIKTNSTGSPGNTWNLKANIPFFWSTSAGYFTNPVSADVTGFYVTCTPSSRLQAKILSA